MKTLIILLNLLLIIPTSFANPTDCDPGFEFNIDRNMCVLSSGAVNANTEAQECGDLTGQAYQDCFNNNVDNSLSENGITGDTEGPKSKALPKIAAVMSLGFGVYALTRGKNLKSCGKASIYMLAAGGLTNILGEALAKGKYKKTLKQLTKDYINRLAESDSNTEEGVDNLVQNQTHAFDFQIDQELAKEKAHKTRATVNNFAGGLYAAAGAVAIYEAISGGSFVGNDCSPKKDKPDAKNDKTIEKATGEKGGGSGLGVAVGGAAIQGGSQLLNGDGANQSNPTDVSSPTADEDYEDCMIENDQDPSLCNLGTPEEAEKDRNSSLLVLAAPKIFGEYYYINHFSAEEVIEVTLRKFSNFIFPSAHASDAAAIPGTFDIFDKIIGAPVTRIVLGGLMSTYSFITAKKAKDLAKLSKERADKIAEIKEGFIVGSNAGFKPCTKKERRLPSRPDCYCTLEDGTPNPQTIETTTCEPYAPNGPLAGPNNYGPNSGGGYTPTGARGCMNNDGTLNVNCDCDNGQCATITGGLDLGPLANISGMKEMLKATKGFVDGRITTDNLNGATANNMAVRLKKMTDKLAKDPKTKKVGKQILSLRKKMQRSFASRAKKAIQNGDVTPDQLNGGIGSSAPVSNSSDVMKAVKAELSKSSNNGAGFSSGKKASMNDFDFGDDSKGGIEMADEKNDIMKRDFKIDDISNNTHGNLFQIISNRYQQSGMKRLFEDAANEK